MAVGIAAARTGDAARANKAEQQLTAMRDARSRLPGQTLDNSLEPLRLAVAGWQAQRAGDMKLALETIRKAADLQDQLGSNYTVIKPVREMLADLLLLNGDQAGALAEYKAVLVLQPNRFDSATEPDQLRTQLETRAPQRPTTSNCLHSPTATSVRSSNCTRQDHRNDGRTEVILWRCGITKNISVVAKPVAGC